MPDLSRMMDNNYAELKNMTRTRERIVPSKALVFGIGKPKLFIKIDKATQTRKISRKSHSGTNILILV